MKKVIRRFCLFRRPPGLLGAKIRNDIRGGFLCSSVTNPTGPPLSSLWYGSPLDTAQQLGIPPPFLPAPSPSFLSEPHPYQAAPGVWTSLSWASFAAVTSASPARHRPIVTLGTSCCVQAPPVSRMPCPSNVSGQLFAMPIRPSMVGFFTWSSLSRNMGSLNPRTSSNIIISSGVTSSQLHPLALSAFSSHQIPNEPSRDCSHVWKR